MFPSSSLATAFGPVGPLPLPRNIAVLIAVGFLIVLAKPASEELCCIFDIPNESIQSTHYIYLASASRRGLEWQAQLEAAEHDLLVVVNWCETSLSFDSESLLFSGLRRPPSDISTVLSMKLTI